MKASGICVLENEYKILDLFLLYLYEKKIDFHHLVKQYMQAVDAVP